VPTDEEFKQDRELIYERNYQLLIGALAKMPENRYFEAICTLPIQDIQTLVIKALCDDTCPPVVRNTFTIHKK
jgi:hypothetical protein